MNWGELGLIWKFVAKTDPFGDEIAAIGVCDAESGECGHCLSDLMALAAFPLRRRVALLSGLPDRVNTRETAYDFWSAASGTPVCKTLVPVRKHGGAT
jgi:hypothetical protein